MVHGFEVLEEGDQRCDVVALSAGLGRECLGLFDGRTAGFEACRVRWFPERMIVCHRHAPVSHRATRILLGGFGKCRSGFLVPKRMQQRHRSVEVFLSRFGAGDGQMHLSQPLGLGARLSLWRTGDRNHQRHY